MNASNQNIGVAVLRELNLAEIEQVAGGAVWACTIHATASGEVTVYCDNA